jgi:phosphate transport system substrate-binding protein
MKKIILITSTLLLTAGMMLNGQNTAFKIKGSDTCLPLLQKLAEIYMKQNASSSISVIGGGSGVGLAALQSGTTDVAMASRKMKMDEKLKMQESGKAFKEVVFANDALSVIVNPSNPVSQLTREQLEGIYTGKVKNWKEVGGKDLAIVIYSRESSSGTFEFFKEHVLQKKNFATTVLLMPATGAIVQSVKQTEGAIGYVGLAYLEQGVKALKVSYDKGKTYVAPSIENAKNKTYPITRPLYLYYLSSVEKTVAPFVTYSLSDAGQKVVVAEGYVSLK